MKYSDYKVGISKTTPAMEFEQFIKTLPEYKTLLFQHGERLFIKRDGEYEILSIRLAHRIHKLATMREVRASHIKIEDFDLFTPLQSR